MNTNANITIEKSIKLPQPGETFEAKGRRWVALGMEQGGLLAISAEPIREMPFDEEWYDDWRFSDIRRYLNVEFLNEIGLDGLMPFVSDLTSDDGMEDYGTSEDYVFLLSCDLYRKYRAHIPKYNTWWWTLTPWSCHPSYANYVRYVLPSGALNYSYAISTHGAVAGLLFNPQSFASGD